jgi:hypothetical protein
MHNIKKRKRLLHINTAVTRNLTSAVYAEVRIFPKTDLIVFRSSTVSEESNCGINSLTNRDLSISFPLLVIVILRIP